MTGIGIGWDVPLLIENAEVRLFMYLLNARSGDVSLAHAHVYGSKVT